MLHSIPYLNFHFHTFPAKPKNGHKWRGRFTCNQNWNKRMPSSSKTRECFLFEIAYDHFWSFLGFAGKAWKWKLRALMEISLLLKDFSNYFLFALFYILTVNRILLTYLNEKPLVSKECMKSRMTRLKLCLKVVPELD